MSTVEGSSVLVARVEADSRAGASGSAVEDTLAGVMADAVAGTPNGAL